MAAGGIVLSGQSKNGNSAEGGATNRQQSTEQYQQPSSGKDADASAIIGSSIEPAARQPITAKDEAYSACYLPSIEECDLAAQRNMAESTGWMNVAAWAGVILTFVGLALLYRTMLYTKKAALHSQEAVTAANNSVTSANRAADESRDIGRAQVRAYLAVDSASYTVYRDWMSIDFQVKNYGHSPAKWCVVHARVRVSNRRWRRDEIEPRFLDSPTHEGEDSFISAGERGVSEISVFWGHTDFDKDVYDMIRATGRHFSVDCIIQWVDVFGEQQRMPFFLVLRSTEFRESEDSRYGTFRIVKQSARPQNGDDQATETPEAA